jgi:hypothetical protein
MKNIFSKLGLTLDPCPDFFPSRPPPLWDISAMAFDKFKEKGLVSDNYHKALKPESPAKKFPRG